jgi:hypothetical protein
MATAKHRTHTDSNGVVTCEDCDYRSQRTGAKKAADRLGVQHRRDVRAAELFAQRTTEAKEADR